MLYSAFLFGLVSSFHCVGMCGPIALMLPVERKNGYRKLLQVLTYQLGRISAYALIGLVFGTVGRGFYLAGFQQRLSVITGIIMVLLALLPERLWSGYTFSRPIAKVLSEIKTALGQSLRKKSFSSLFTIGLLNGFLPCGMVYAAVFGALSMQRGSLGIAYMLLFGLGTIPLMTAVVFFRSTFGNRMRNTIQKIIPYAVACIGILFILRGAGLGIPFISPAEISLFVAKKTNCH